MNHTPEHREYLRQKMIVRNTRHGYARRGESSYEYRIWKAMRERCHNPNHFKWKDYGGRGIKIAERWNDFETFLFDVGPSPTRSHQIDRYPDNDGDYEPGNTRWATPKQQANNKRNNFRVTVEGITRTVTEWSALSRVRAGLITWRIKKGWELKDAVYRTPKQYAPRKVNNVASQVKEKTRWRPMTFRLR